MGSWQFQKGLVAVCIARREQECGILNGLSRYRLFRGCTQRSVYCRFRSSRAFQWCHIWFLGSLHVETFVGIVHDLVRLEEHLSHGGA